MSRMLQSAIWSEYKHHNSGKFLVRVAPNSSVIYISEGYTGSIPDKPLTKDSGFSDEIPPFCSPWQIKDSIYLMNVLEEILL